MDANKTKEKLRGEADRQPVTLYLSKSLYEEFKLACEEIKPNKVMEELMKDFIQSSYESKPKKKRSLKKNLQK